MDGKVLLVLIGIINYSLCAGLLRTPKVYNAVITTDENLTPSRAIPVIQPTIHETGIATYPFGPFPQYRFYNPVAPFGQPHPNELPFAPNPTAPAEMPPEVQMRDYAPIKPNPMMIGMPEENVPIPLNEFGLPPSLIPLQHFPQHPVNLQPYPYNHYPPLIYGGYNQYQDHLLPPYGYYPHYSFGIQPPAKKPNKPKEKPENNYNQKNSEESDGSAEKPQINDIKNSGKHKNRKIPDVPPPPLPSGAKSSQKSTSDIE